MIDIRHQLRLVLVLLVACMAVTSVAQAVAHEPDARWNKSIGAGPFSEVSTAFGSLETIVPIVSLECRGNVGIELSFRHRMNTASGYSFDATDGAPGKGWQTNFNSAVLTKNAGGLFSVVQTSYGSDVNYWHITSIDGSTGAITGLNRMPGVRADVQELRSGSVRTGFIVTDQASKNKHIYQYDVGNAHQTFRLTRIEDPRGNAVTVSYDSYGRTYRVTDPVGRYLQFYYNSGGANEQINYVALVTDPGHPTDPDTTREWDLDQDSNDLLGGIYWPAPTGTTKPYLEFWYTTETNLSQIYDFNHRRWLYTYTAGGNHPVFADAIRLTRVDPPHPTNASASDLPINFSWQLESGQTERVCYISDTVGLAITYQP